ncbi:death domain-associated protein 6-like [Polyodon spathula]|uniref:death domain-associated protein 6-like n=1 Tax=Polyodon spathula TaxID=7913 RepID=UPI001B7E797D|nr:death domain-associated protein 6-like [Polyodon spathula]
MNSIIILDDDEDELPSSSTSHTPPPRGPTNHMPQRSHTPPSPTNHSTKPTSDPPTSSNHKPDPWPAPSFSTNQSSSGLLVNMALFHEFVQYCSGLTSDHPEVISYLCSKQSQASKQYLGSVEFRNALGRCLTHVQRRRGKAYVFISELCTALRANSHKRKLQLSHAGTHTQQHGVETCDPAGPVQGTEEPAEQQQEEEEERGKTAKASKRQIRYLESLLKVYSDEIQKLQEKELELEDLQDEDSSYIQEHRLKRKMMKIYEKLCELKGCSAQTGRVIEQRIQYSGTRYPEINKRVERFINNPSQSGAFPDYSDILHVMTRASEKHQLGLGRKQLQSLAQDAFRDVGNRLQERRHLDLVYNFGSHLTDQYSARADPALSDPSLSKKLHSNRALALSSIDQVITKYAAFQDEMEEQERNRRIEREKEKKEKEGEGTSGAQVKETLGGVVGPLDCSWADPQGGGVYFLFLFSLQDKTLSMNREEEEEEDEEEEEEEEEFSSDPDIEEELERAAEGEDEEKAEGGAQDRLMAKESGISCSEEEAESNREEVAEDSQLEKSQHEDRKSETQETTSGTQTRMGEAAATGSPSPPASPSQSGTREVSQEVGDSPSDDIMEVEQKTANRNSPLSLCLVIESSPLSSSGSAIQSTGLSPKANEMSLCGSLLSCLSSIADSPLLPRVLISSNLDNSPRSPSPPLSDILDSPLLVCSQASNHSSSGEGHRDTTANHSSSRSVKRKQGSSPPNKKQEMNGRSEVANKASVDSVDEEISLDREVYSSSPPDSRGTVFPVADSTRADSPLSQLVSSSQPSSSKCNPNKRKKVTVATQCNPEEVIVLSDSD